MITLIGHGYIGTAISKRLKDFEWISHLEAPSKNTSFIINATGFIGFPNADQCEIEKEECMDANVVFPLKLERENKVSILHITSGCVYQGYPEGGYKETDVPNLNFNNGSFYGGCKSLLQTLIKPYLNKSYLFRIRLPFDESKHFRNLLHKYDKFERLIDVENSITSVDDMLDCIDLFVKDRPPFGMYNVTNVGSTTTKEIANMMGLKKEWMTNEDFKEVVKAVRSNCTLNTDKITSVFKMPNIQESLEKTIKKYREIYK